MREIVIKILVDGGEVTQVQQEKSGAQPQPHINETQRVAGHEAIERIENLLLEHGKWTTKPVPPIKLISVQHSIERFLGIK